VLLQSEIFKALETTRLLIGDRKEIQYSRCGRTDKGVSAVGQVGCFPNKSSVFLKIPTWYFWVDWILIWKLRARKMFDAGDCTVFTIQTQGHWCTQQTFRGDCSRRTGWSARFAIFRWIAELYLLVMAFSF